MMNKKKRTTSRTPILDSILEKIDPLDSVKTEDRMLIAARIHDLISEKGWNKKYFADKLRKEPSVITKWLSGTHNFTQDTLTEIRYALGVSLAELVDTRPKPFSPLPQTSPLAVRV